MVKNLILQNTKGKNTLKNIIGIQKLSYQRINQFTYYIDKI